MFAAALPCAGAISLSAVVTDSTTHKAQQKASTSKQSHSIATNSQPAICTSLTTAEHVENYFSLQRLDLAKMIAYDKLCLILVKSLVFIYQQKETYTKTS